MFLRGRRGAICSVKGSDVRPGVPLVGSGSATFAWQAWIMCNAKGSDVCPDISLRSSWCASGVPWTPLILCDRRR